MRGPEVRSLGLTLPPARMPLLKRGRPLKRWRYVALYRPDFMVCVGDARVAGIPQRWWAVALPDGTLLERTTGAAAASTCRPGARAWTRTGCSSTSRSNEGPGVEVVSPHGRSWIWTRKQARRAGARVGALRRRARVGGGRRRGLRGRVRRLPRAPHRLALVGRHRPDARRPRRGVEPRGRRARRARVERAHALGGRRARPRCRRSSSPPTSRGSATSTSPPGARARTTRAGSSSAATTCSRSGRFTGALPGGVELASGYGVMEWHDVRW